MSAERIVYKVSFPVPTETEPRRRVSIEVSAHPDRKAHVIKTQVWLMLVKKGYEVDPAEGGIEVIGTEKTEES